MGEQNQPTDVGAADESSFATGCLAAVAPLLIAGLVAVFLVAATQGRGDEGLIFYALAALVVAFTWLAGGVALTIALVTIVWRRTRGTGKRITRFQAGIVFDAVVWLLITGPVMGTMMYNTYINPATGAKSAGVLGWQSVVWDAADARMLVFASWRFIGTTGGVTPSTTDVWSYDPTAKSWSRRSPAGDLPPSGEPSGAVWDAADGRMLVIGPSIFSVATSGPAGDLWTYSPVANSWSRLSPAGDRPPNRLLFSTVWDAADERMLIFGGRAATGTLNDLWSYNPTANTWSQLSPTGSLPPAGAASVAVWDAADAHMLVFTGSGVVMATPLDDLWSYNPATNSWSQLSPTGDLPRGRVGFSAVWDTVDARMLVFGGNGDTGPLNELWNYNPAANAWSKLSPSGSLPPSRYHHSAVWDTVDARMLVFGGDSGADYGRDLWSYGTRANSWSRLANIGP